MTSRALMSADDTKLVTAHRDFSKWEKKNPMSGTLGATDFSFALRHYDKCQRAITKNYQSFSSKKTCTCAMVTTYIIWGGGDTGKQGRTRDGSEPC